MLHDFQSAYRANLGFTCIIMYSVNVKQSVLITVSWGFFSLFKQYQNQGCFTVWMGYTPCVVLINPDLAKKCFARKGFSGRAPLALVLKEFFGT